MSTRLRDIRQFQLRQGGEVVADGICYADSWTFDFPDGLLFMEPGWCEVRWRDGCTTTALWQSVDLLMHAMAESPPRPLVGIELEWRDS